MAVTALESYSGLLSLMLLNAIMRLILIRLCTLSLAICSSLVAAGQQLTDRLIFSFPSDAGINDHTAVDSDGHYFQYHDSPESQNGDTLIMDGGRKILLKKEQYVPPEQMERWSPHPPVIYAWYDTGLALDGVTDGRSLPQYFKTRRSTKLYGPKPGDVQVDDYLWADGDLRYLTLSTFRRADTFYFYINDSLVMKADSGRAKFIRRSISDNEQFVLYSAPCARGYGLYLNSRLIDSSDVPFEHLSVNDSGYYLYTACKTWQWKQAIYVTTRDSSFGPLEDKPALHCRLNDDNSYYLYGCDTNNCFLLVNGQYLTIKAANAYAVDPRNGNMVTVPPTLDHISVRAGRYIFAYVATDASHGHDTMVVQVAGNRYVYPQRSVSSAEIRSLYADKSGHFMVSKFGNQNDGWQYGDTVYSNHPIPAIINGKRFTRACFTASGNVIQRIGDSVFVDGRLLISDKADSLWVEELRPDNVLITGTHVSYVLFRGKLSKPLPVRVETFFLDTKKLLTGYHWMMRIGDIADGFLGDGHYYLIVKTGAEQFLIVIDNKIYRTINGISNIIAGSSYFKDGQLIFYARKGAGCYEYRLTYQ